MGCRPRAPTAFNKSASRRRVVEVATTLGLPLPPLGAVAVVLGPERVAWLADQARIRFHAAA